MPPWKTTTVLTPCDYKNIAGLPSQVEIEVKELIDEGSWHLNSRLFDITIDGCDIVVQSMVKYEAA